MKLKFFCAITLLCALAAATHAGPLVQVAGRQFTTKPEDASVVVFNPPGTVKGTMTACGATHDKLILSGVAHTFAGKVGGHFQVGSADGRISDATLVLWKPEIDSAVATTSLDATAGICFPVRYDIRSDRRPSDTFSLVGYPSGQGPNRDDGLTWIETTYLQNAFNRPSWRNQWSTTEHVIGGHSGGGVFVNNEFLIGTLSNSNWDAKAVAKGRMDQAKGYLAFSVPNVDLCAALEEAAALIDCNGPNCWKPTPSGSANVTSRDPNDPKLRTASGKRHALEQDDLRLDQQEQQIRSLQQALQSPPMPPELNPAPPPEDQGHDPLLVGGAIVTALGVAVAFGQSRQGSF